MTQIAVTRSCPPAPHVNGNWLHRLFSVARQRRELARLDDRALSDIGVSRQQAHKEATRPFWDAPESWSKRLY